VLEAQIQHQHDTDDRVRTHQGGYRCGKPRGAQNRDPGDQKALDALYRLKDLADQK